MGRIVIKRSIGSVHDGAGIGSNRGQCSNRYNGLVFTRGQFYNTRSSGKPDSMLDLEYAKDGTDAHFTIYYSLGRKEMTEATEATPRSNSIKEDHDSSDIDNIDGENSVNSDEAMEQTVSSGAKGVKRKRFPASFIDSIINGTTEEPSMAPQTKMMCLDYSIPECHENTVKPMQDMNSNHALLKIPPTERKKWPQKACVLCRKYGFRNDTRYFCIICNAALCKDTCFSKYHCNNK